MVYSLTYRRPPHVDSARASINGSEKTKSIDQGSISSRGSSVFAGIPDALSFDKIINGGTCPVSSHYTPLLSTSAAIRSIMYLLGYLAKSTISSRVPFVTS